MSTITENNIATFLCNFFFKFSLIWHGYEVKCKICKSIFLYILLKAFYSAIK